MVMTKDKRGIECDTCGAEYRENFTYYSCTLDKIDVSAARSSSDNSGSDVEKRFLDLEICEKCWGDMKARMMEIINKREEKAKKAVKNKQSDWSVQDGTVSAPGNQDRQRGPAR